MAANYLPEPMSRLGEAASGMHELFIAYQAAGFSSSQALYLVGVHLATAISGPQRPPGEK